MVNYNDDMTISNRRRILFRVSAILLGCVPFALAEWGLRTMPVPAATAWQDPFISFAEEPRLFRHDKGENRHTLRHERQPYFCPVSFPTAKSARALRVFVLGGSTVQGRPYAPDTAFSHWLQLRLAAVEPNRAFEVINCGGVSYASYRLVPIVREVLQYDADLIVLYTGHNEFLEARTFGDLREAPRALQFARQLAAKSRLVTSCATWIGGSQPSDMRKQLAAEVDTILDHTEGPTSYQRDVAWHQFVSRHFDVSLRAIVTLAHEANVPLLMIRPLTNLKDCQPFKSQHGDNVSPANRERFDRLYLEAIELTDVDLDRRARLLEEAVELDPQHAGGQFHWGKTLEWQRRFAEANEAFLRARNEDVCPLRMTESLYHVLDQVAKDHAVPLLDLQAIVAARCEGEICGDEVLLDHVHPSIACHQQIARIIHEWMVEQQFAKRVTPHDETSIADQFRRYWSELDATYFARGKERLEGLRRWSQGRKKLE